MAALVDTNVLVYRFDARFPDKQRIATEVLRRGLADDTVRFPHQAIEDFQHDRLYGTVRAVDPFRVG